jgi:hypothetical protein
LMDSANRPNRQTAQVEILFTPAMTKAIPQ